VNYPTIDKKLLLGGRDIKLRIVKDPDSLLDGDIKGEKLPYWAELWPSARALSSYLANFRFRGEPVLDLGCGMGLTTVAICCAGGVPLAIDYDPEALLFAKHNVEQNGFAGSFARMDWNHLALSRSFPYIVAADILYERAELPKIAGLLRQHLQQAGEIFIAEPGREIAKAFFAQLTRYQLCVIQKIPTPIERVTIWRLGKLF
jgi:predicted nicotinamide N-methyase